jgi:hypothetical protein
MSKNEKPSTLDYTNAITSSHNEEAKALNVINVNSLVPTRFGKIDIDYITSGFGIGEIGTVRYYSNGAYQETKVITRGDKLGSAHKTTISFINRTPASLAGKAIILYDNGGAVKVWFNVDFGSIEPTVPGTYRSIVVNLLSGNDHETVAKKTALALSMDSQFLAVYSLYYIIVSSATVGSKPDSKDFNTSLYIKNTAGIDPITLNNKYFYINSATNATQYYVWYNVNGAGVNPNIVGKTGVMVAISTGSTAQTVAQATKNTLDALGHFITNIDSDTLLITNGLIGVTDLAQDVNTGFLFFVQKEGQGRDLLVTLNLSYSNTNDIISVERL